MRISPQQLSHTLNSHVCDGALTPRDFRLKYLQEYDWTLLIRWARSRSKKISQTLVTLIETKNPAVCCVTFCICSDQDCSFVFVFKNDQSQRFQFLFTNDEVEADLSWKMEMKCQDFITLVCTNKQSVINWYRYIIIRSGQLEKKWSNNK